MMEQPVPMELDDETDAPAPWQEPDGVHDGVIRRWMAAIAALLVQVSAALDVRPAHAGSGTSLAALLDQELDSLMIPPGAELPPETLCQLALSHELPTFIARNDLSPLWMMWWTTISLQQLDVPRTDARRRAIAAVRAWTERQLRHTDPAQIERTWTRLGAMADLTCFEAEGVREAARSWRAGEGRS